MGQPLEIHIRELQEFYWSAADPDGRGFVHLADALRRAGELREAGRVLREGLGRHPDYLSGHVVAAWLSLDLGKPEEAESRFRTALELDPRNLAALRGLAEILLGRGELGAALEVMEVLVHEDPLDLDLPGRVKDLKARLGEADTTPPEPVHEPAPQIWDDPEGVAEELNWDMAALQPDSSPRVEPEEGEGVASQGNAVWGVEDSWSTPGVVEDGEPLPAMDDLHQTLVTATLGEIYLRQGLLDRAEGVFQSLLEENPANEQARLRLSEVRALKGRAGGGPGPGVSEPEKEATAGPGIVSIDSLAPDAGRWPEVGERSREDPGTFTPPGPSVVVPIESLAPDRKRPAPMVDSEPAQTLPIEALAPDEILPMEALAPDEILPIEALAPDEILPMEALAPDEILPMEALAPDEILPMEALAPDEILPMEALAPDEILPMEALAPDEILPMEALAPDEILPIEALAPDEILPIEALAPDYSPGGEGGDGGSDPSDPDGDPSLDAFERWLDRLQ